MNKNLLGSALAVAFTFAMGSAQALNMVNGIGVDNFNTGGQSASVLGTGTDTNTVTGLLSSDTVGGSRTVSIDSNSVADDEGAKASVVPEPVAGVFAHSADSFASGTSTITWDANGAGLGGLDFVGGLTDNQFKFDIQSIDLGAIDLTLTVTDLLGNSDSVTLSGAVVGEVSIDYAAFSGVNLGSVDSLSLQVVGAVAADLRLDSFSTMGAVVHDVVSVPEPAPLALMAIGLLALGLRRRKVK